MVRALMVGAGAVLTASPFIAIFVAMAADEGALFAAVMFGVVALMVAVVVAGIGLIAKGLDP